jgi:hypothetical protein
MWGREARQSLIAHRKKCEPSSFDYRNYFSLHIVSALSASMLLVCFVCVCASCRRRNMCVCVGVCVCVFECTFVCVETVWERIVFWKNGTLVSSPAPPPDLVLSLCVYTEMAILPRETLPFLFITILIVIWQSGNIHMRQDYTYLSM